MNEQRVSIKPRQRDKYIDKSKFQSPEDKEWHPRKMIKREVSKNQKRQQMVSNLNSNNQTFSSLQLSPLEPFLEYSGKFECKCKRRVKYYCTKCMSVNTELPLPQVHLNVNVMILHHPEQKQSKSTGIPLRLLSDQISVVQFKQDLEPLPENTYVLYPHKDSILVKDLTETPSLVIAVDCTWYQTNSVLQVLQKQKVKYIRLEGYQTNFWRYQHHGSQTLSTAEAVYFFTREYYKDYLKVQDLTPLDNLMFLYVLNYNLIQRYHKEKKASDLVQVGRQAKTIEYILQYIIMSLLNT